MTSPSIRKRGNDSWQLRVYIGTDADSGRERWATTTVHGTHSHALDQRVLLAARDRPRPPARRQVGDLLER